MCVCFVCVFVMSFSTYVYYVYVFVLAYVNACVRSQMQVCREQEGRWEGGQVGRQVDEGAYIRQVRMRSVLSCFHGPTLPQQHVSQEAESEEDHDFPFREILKNYQEFVKKEVLVINSQK